MPCLKDACYDRGSTLRKKNLAEVFSAEQPPKTIRISQVRIATPRPSRVFHRVKPCFLLKTVYWVLFWCRAPCAKSLGKYRCTAYKSYKHTQIIPAHANHTSKTSRVTSVACFCRSFLRVFFASSFRSGRGITPSGLIVDDCQIVAARTTNDERSDWFRRDHKQIMATTRTTTKHAVGATGHKITQRRIADG